MISIEREGARPERILAHAWSTSDFFIDSPRPIAYAVGQVAEIHRLEGAISLLAGRENIKPESETYFDSTHQLGRHAFRCPIDTHRFVLQRKSLAHSGKTKGTHSRTSRIVENPRLPCCNITNIRQTAMATEKSPSSRSSPPRKKLSKCHRYSVSGITRTNSPVRTRTIRLLVAQDQPSLLILPALAMELFLIALRYKILTLSKRKKSIRLSGRFDVSKCLVKPSRLLLVDWLRLERLDGGVHRFQNSLGLGRRVEADICNHQHGPVVIEHVAQHVHAAADTAGEAAFLKKLFVEQAVIPLEQASAR